jgi:sec-independent protein translocase protein TatC
MENKVATFIGEVEKARKGMAVCVVLFLALAGLCFTFSERVLLVLVRLLGKKLVSYSPEEGFIALASLSLYCAFVLTLPAVAYLLWRRLILPRVPAWRRWGGPVIAIGAVLFACGAVLGYFVLLPAGIGFLVGFETRDVRALISAKKFISFCGTMMITLGLAFQAPLLAFFLAKLGWLKPAFFQNRWRYAILICTVLSAIITPTPDVYNMTLMTMPLLGLYFVSFLVVYVVAPGRVTTPLPKDDEGVER